MRITLASQVAIEARLLKAPEEGRTARVKAAGGVRLTGQVGPCDEDMNLPMVPDQVEFGGLGVGSPAHVTIYDGHEVIAFYTTVREVTARGHLLLGADRAAPATRAVAEGLGRLLASGLPGVDHEATQAVAALAADPVGAYRAGGVIHSFGLAFRHDL